MWSDQVLNSDLWLLSQRHYSDLTTASLCSNVINLNIETQLRTRILQKAGLDCLDVIRKHS